MSMSRPAASVVLFSLAVSAILLGCDGFVESSSPTSQPSAEAAPVPAAALPAAVISGDTCVPLMAGQHTVAGSVCAIVDGDSVRVTYETTGGWSLVETHLWAGQDVSVLGTGGLALGRFPWTAEGLGNVTTHSETLPLSHFGGLQGGSTCPGAAQFVAHAVVQHPSKGRETAYGSGKRLSQKGNWAMWFGLPLVCTGTTIGEGGGTTRGCVAAWGRTSESFTFVQDLGGQDGWMNGPYLGGEFILALRSTAGDSVGRVRVVYEGPRVMVQYLADPGMGLEETHAYAGAPAVPTAADGTVLAAPGLFPSVHLGLAKASSDLHTVPDMDGDVHVAAHAVVCPVAP